MSMRDSRRTLSEKLGLRAGTVAAVVEPPREYRRLIGHVPFGVLFVPADADGLGFVHVFVRNRAALRSHLAVLRLRIRPDGMIWVSWPKKASGVATDLTEDAIREEAVPLGLVDVKVCAVDETWSALKLVVRRDRRPPQAGTSRPRRKK